MKCERCGVKPEGKYGLHDYCNTCCKNLCKKCMEEGCCNKVPAISGMNEDFADQAEQETN